MKAYIYKNENGIVWHRTHTENPAYGVSTVVDAEIVEPPKAKYIVCDIDDTIFVRPHTARAALEYADKAGGTAFAEIDNKLHRIKSEAMRCPGTILDAIIYVIDDVRCVKTKTHFEPLETIDNAGRCLGGYGLPYVEAVKG